VSTGQSEDMETSRKTEQRSAREKRGKRALLGWAWPRPEGIQRGANARGHEVALGSAISARYQGLS